MPSKPLKPCKHPLCNTLTRNQSYCDEHQRPAFANRQGNTTDRGYGHNWRKLRGMILTREPYCRECNKQGRARLAETVDHIIPKVNGGDDSDGNLQPLCYECHKTKTSKEANTQDIVGGTTK